MSGRSDCQSADHRPVRRLEFSVEWPPGHAAAYLLDGPEPILVDAGMDDEENTTELIEGLAEYDYAPGDIEHVLLTHLHTDHVGQLGTVLNAGEATVHAPARVRDRFERSLDTIETATRRNLAAAGVEESYREIVAENLVDAHERNRAALAPEMVDHWIGDGETFTIDGLTFESIYAPGHHCTHLCYATTLGESSVLFAGDMAIEPFRAAAIHANFDDGVRDGVSAFFEALDRLGEHSFDRVYPGHGPVHDRFDAMIERSVTDLQQRVESCADAIAAESGQTAADIAAEQADDLQERARILPEVVGALAHLADQGRVTATMHDGVRRYS